MQSLTLQWISKVFSLRNSHFILFFLYFVYLNLDDFIFLIFCISKFGKNFIEFSKNFLILYYYYFN